MTYYEYEEKKKKFSTNRHRLMTCPECLSEYTLGIDGTVYGCDKCQGIERNSQGMIINTDLEVFIHEEQS